MKFENIDERLGGLKVMEYLMDYLTKTHNFANGKLIEAKESNNQKDADVHAGVMLAVELIAKIIGDAVEEFKGESPEAPINVPDTPKEDLTPLE